MKPEKKPYTIRESKISGQGLFASTFLPWGTFIFEITGEIVEHEYEPNFSPEGPNWMAYAINKWIKTDEDHPWTRLNHSCDPNVGFEGNLRVVAMRNIEAGEELTVDYAITEVDPYWSMKCVRIAKLPKNNPRVYSFTKSITGEIFAICSEVDTGISMTTFTKDKLANFVV